MNTSDPTNNDRWWANINSKREEKEYAEGKERRNVATIKAINGGRTSYHLWQKMSFE